VCAMLDSRRPSTTGANYGDQIEFVRDRPGHDFRYAVDTSRSERELDWHVGHTVNAGLEKTIEWYLANPDWLSQEAVQ
jgi:dTDP-glucose 4,6-dehydratase